MSVTPDSLSGPELSQSERNMAPHYDFVATTEADDSAHAVTLSGRITEISRKGCFVDTVNVLPAGTLLQLRISCEQGTVATRGKIVYAQERIGMGIVFRDLPEDQSEVLDSWLTELSTVTVA